MNPSRRKSWLAFAALAPVTLLVACVSHFAAGDDVTVTINGETWKGTLTKVLPASQPSTPTGGPVVVPPVTPAPDVAADPTPRNFLGVNLERPVDWNREAMFIDAVKTARRFGPPAQPWDEQHPAPVDADGWPTQDFGAVVISGAPADWAGHYKVSCRGKAHFTNIACPAVITGERYDPASNTTSCDWLATPSAADAGGVVQIMMSVTQTARNDGSGLAGVRNLKVLRPGYADDSAAFTNEFLAALAPFGGFRAMWYAQAPGNPSTDWSTRVKVTDALYSGDKGGPLELMVTLCNRTHKAAWLCVPFGSTPDFWRGLAQYLKANWDGGAPIYLEYSNEVWNGGVYPAQRNQDAAAAELAANPSTNLNVPSTNGNVWYLAHRRTARQIHDIALVFRQAFAGDPRLKLIRPVLADQISAPDFLRDSLAWLNQTYGPPADYLYGVAGAPYFGCDGPAAQAFNARNDLTAQMVADWLTSQTGSGKFATIFGPLAAKYGLRNVAYEGGVDLGQYNASVAAKTAAQFLPQTGQAVGTYLNTWYASGGNEMFYLTLAVENSWAGYWGLTTDVQDLNQPKYQAAAACARKLATQPAN